MVSRLIKYRKTSVPFTVPDEMSRVPTLATPDYKLIGIDRDWVLHKLPYEPVEVPREHLPDPESENIPSIINQQETVVDLERRWADTGIDRVFLSCTQFRRI